MRRLSHVLAIALAAALTLTAGVIHGRISQRWGLPPIAVAAARNLGDIPSQFGGWRVRSTQRLSEGTTRELQCVGYLARTYVNEVTGETVGVTLLLGPAGPIAVHTPEVCMGSRAFRIRDPRRRVKIETPQGPADEFWGVTFQTTDVDASLIRVYYGWTIGNRWSAPTEPRFSFAGQPYLYKIQLASHLPPGSSGAADDAGRRFLADFIPVARQFTVEPSGD